MEAEISQSEQWLRFVAWLEDNFRRVVGTAAVVIGVGVVVAFFVWQGAEKERTASEALSVLLMAPEATSSSALLALAEEHDGTGAAIRARLLAGGALYAEGQFEEARQQFQAILAGSVGSGEAAQARFGIAACREALGETDEAIGEYRSLVSGAGNGNVVPLARFALAQLYEEKGELTLAREQYEKLQTSMSSSLAAEAGVRLAALPAPAVEEAVVPSAAVEPVDESSPPAP